MRLAYLRFLVVDLRNHLATKAGYDPNQPRDEAGRWAEIGGSSTATANSSSPDVTSIPTVLRTIDGVPIDDAAYNGYFHDAVRDHLVGTLRGAGRTVVTEVPLTLPGDHPVTARSDILATTASGEVLGIEVKTGIDPTFTTNQMIVYPHVVFGTGVISTDPRISLLGLMPDRPLSALNIDIVHAPGPNEKITVESLRRKLE